MSDPFIAEVKIFAGNFAPRSFAFCNGQLLSIAQNTALFALIGTIYGGNGQTTFGLPNLQGRAPMHPGNGPGLSPRQLGETGGSETVTLTSAQLASHSHPVRAASNATSAAPAGNFFGSAPMYNTGGNTVAMAADSVTESGGGQPHNNMQPYLAINFIICLQGIFPSRN
jgi:microcystin-dependent protein